MSLLFPNILFSSPSGSALGVVINQRPSKYNIPPALYYRWSSFLPDKFSIKNSHLSIFNMDFCHLQIISNCLLFTYIWCMCTYWTAFYVRKWKSASWSVFNCQNNIVHFYQYHIWNCLWIIHRTMVFLCVKLVWELVKEKLVVQFLFLYLCITDFHLYPQNTGFSLYNCKTRLRTCLREVSCPVAHLYKCHMRKCIWIIHRTLGFLCISCLRTCPREVSCPVACLSGCLLSLLLPCRQQLKVSNWKCDSD